MGALAVVGCGDDDDTGDDGGGGDPDPTGTTAAGETPDPTATARPDPTATTAPDTSLVPTDGGQYSFHKGITYESHNGARLVLGHPHLSPNGSR